MQAVIRVRVLSDFENPSRHRAVSLHRRLFSRDAYEREDASPLSPDRLLEPARVDPDDGYRSYTTDQIPTAQLIRRFRELQMPLKRIRDDLEATDPETCSALITSHLNALQSNLAETQSVVTSLRDLLSAAKAQTHEGELDLEGMIGRAAFSVQ
jgi:DNA-binding transcriptional MerR regulator